MALTTPKEVRQLVPVDPDIDLNIFISIAETFTTMVSERATEIGVAFPTNGLRNMQTLLAAHFYAIRDPQAAQEGAGKSSATFQGKTAMSLDYTPWGQQAKLMDITGLLGELSKGRQLVTGFWLGTEL